MRRLVTTTTKINLTRDHFIQRKYQLRILRPIASSADTRAPGVANSSNLGCLDFSSHLPMRLIATTLRHRQQELGLPCMNNNVGPMLLPFVLMKCDG